VEALARKSLAELVQLMENVLGLAQYQAKYEIAQQALVEAEQAAIFVIKQQKVLRGERKLLQQQKEEVDRFHILLERSKHCNKNCTYVSCTILNKIDSINKKRLNRCNKNTEKANQEAAATLKEARKLASAARWKTGQAEKKRVQVALHVDWLEPALLETTEEIKTLKKKLVQDEKQLEGKRKEADSHQNSVALQTLAWMTKE